MMEPVKLDDLGGSTISGNPHLSHWKEMKRELSIGHLVGHDTNLGGEVHYLLEPFIG